MIKQLAILINQYPVQSETFVRTEIEALEQLGVTVTVLCFQFNATLYEQLGLQHEVVQISDSKQLEWQWRNAISAYKVANSIKSLSNHSLLYYGARIAAISKARHITHIHTHFMHGALSYAIVAKQFYPLTLTAIGHGHDIYVNNQDLDTKLSLVDGVIAVCRQMQSYFLQTTQVPTALIHCGVNTQKFRSSSYNPGGRLLFVGRLVEKKGLAYLFEAMQGLPESISVDIVGDGPLLESLQQQVNSLGLSQRVHFLGFRNNTWLIENAKDYSALVAPFCIAKNGDRDTGPLVLKEAMSLGLPVITTYVMGCREIVSQQCGYLVAPQDPQQLANAINNFMALPSDKKQALSEAARNWVESHFNAVEQAKVLLFNLERW